jgi:hypothetical protein
MTPHRIISPLGVKAFAPIPQVFLSTLRKEVQNSSVFQRGQIDRARRDSNPQPILTKGLLYPPELRAQM